MTTHSSVLFVLNQQRVAVRLRLSALAWKRAFYLLFGNDEAELRQLFQYEQYPDVPWLNVAQDRLIGATCAAGEIAGAELGFTPAGPGVEERPFPLPMLWTVEEGRA